MNTRENKLLTSFDYKGFCHYVCRKAVAGRIRAFACGVKLRRLQYGARDRNTFMEIISATLGLLCTLNADCMNRQMRYYRRFAMHGGLRYVRCTLEDRRKAGTMAEVEPADLERVFRYVHIRFIRC